MRPRDPLRISSAIDQKRSVFAGFQARKRIQSLIPSELIAARFVT